ncbi:MAG: apolipoprotein N-acyltransferase [Chitinispirillaceae bacterium]|nr:apolipoprotein N-acyltransferase [Chitinispirillaceae bacterium]
MLQITIQKAIQFYNRNHLWLPAMMGALFFLCLPPFNHELHPLFSFFPFLSFISLIPLLFYSLQKPLKKALLETYIFSYFAALSQVFWLIYVKIEGVWILIIIGMFLLAGYVALFYLAAGMLFRFLYNRSKKGYIIIFPAIWIIIDYIRTLGELSFPWCFLGYSFTPITPLNQLASITGVWGLTYLIVLVNMLVWDLLVNIYRGNKIKKNLQLIGLLVLSILIISVYGIVKILNNSEANQKEIKIALLQTSIDQLNWGNKSLDTSFAVTESLSYLAAKDTPDVIIGPESALLCFLARQFSYAQRVSKLVDSLKIPILLGAVHWDVEKRDTGEVVNVYNTAFLIRPFQKEFIPYRKIKLVPFSEAMPFEGVFPILSRVNLGEADFSKGKENTIFIINDSIRIAPFICYEIIYPNFVRERLRQNVNLIAHITNDGWFGKTTGPYQHATMARMRAIENGVPLARCAITGISMLANNNGKIISNSSLYKRCLIKGNLPLSKANTFYSRYGDWFVGICLLIVIFGTARKRK